MGRESSSPWPARPPRDQAKRDASAYFEPLVLACSCSRHLAASDGHANERGSIKKEEVMYSLEQSIAFRLPCSRELCPFTRE